MEMGILRDRACFRRPWTNAIILLHGGALVSSALLCISFISFCPPPQMTIGSFRTKNAGMRFFHSSMSLSLSSPPKKHKILIDPSLDDMYPHVLIKGRREQCGMI